MWGGPKPPWCPIPSRVYVSCTLGSYIGINPRPWSVHTWLLYLKWSSDNTLNRDIPHCRIGYYNSFPHLFQNYRGHTCPKIRENYGKPISWSITIMHVPPGGGQTTNGLLIYDHWVWNKTCNGRGKQIIIQIDFHLRTIQQASNDVVILIHQRGTQF